MSHTHTMICTCCGAQATVTNDTPCEADPFPFTDEGGRIAAYDLFRTASGRLFVERVEYVPWSDPGYVSVQARPVDESDVLVNGAPRPGWYTTQLDWGKGPGRGYRPRSGYILSHVKLESDGQVTTMTGDEFYEWLDNESKDVIV